MQLKLINDSGVALKVTKAEHELLMICLNRPNRVICREEIITVLADEAMYGRAIDSRISRLKKKFQNDDVAKNPIQSVYCCGYAFHAQVDIESA